VISSFTQAERPLRITTPLGDDALFVVGLDGREAISELFEFQLELVAPRASVIEFVKLLGQPVSVVFEPAQFVPRWLHGIATTFLQGRADEDFIYYAMTVAPKLWWLTQQHNSRIFQQINVPDILRAVFAGYDVRFELTGTYLPRNYCVQYRETDFAFASRLMEEEGIFYTFEFDDEKHTLVVADANVNLPNLGAPPPNADQAAKELAQTVLFEELNGGTRNEARITSWTKTQRVMPTRVTLWDHSFELVGQNLQAQEAILPKVKVGTVDHQLPPTDSDPEVYDYPGAYAKRFDGVAPGGGDRSSDPPNTFQDNQRTTRLRMQELAARTIAISATSNSPHLTAGHQFTLARQGHGDGDYVLTSIDHHARLDVDYRSKYDEVALEYKNEFTCLPLDLPFRPVRKTPRPQIAGVQTATVVGPDGAEIFVDKYGRVKVQFHWDRIGVKDADSSCWVRVAQVWAGNRWGAFFWPRINHEVVVTFLEGDPDRPLIIGSVYNAANMPPPSLPDDNTIGGIKSCIFGGDSMVNFNAITFHDTPGHEFVQIHSEQSDMQHSEHRKFNYVPDSEISIRGSWL
jgi:type VI secretion system secreted protein VgrG